MTIENARDESGGVPPPSIVKEEHLDERPLVASLESIRPRVMDVAVIYDPKDPESFMKCVREVLLNVSEAWEAFGAHCDPFKNAARKSRDTIREWSAIRDRILGTVERHLEQAKNELEDNFRKDLTNAAHQATRRKTRAHVEEVSDEEAVREELRALVAGVTGHNEGEIPAKSAKLSFWVGVVASMLFGLAEIMAGTDFFRQVGSILGAVGTITILVVLLSVTAVFLGMSMKRCLYWLVARSRFHRNFPDEQPDVLTSGRRIAFLPLAPKWPVILAVTFVGLAVGSWSLLSWRLYLAKTDPLLQGTGAMAWIVFAAVWFLVLLEFFISPEYDERYHEEYEELRQRLAEIQQAPPPTKRDDWWTSEPGLASGRRLYQQRISDARGYIASEILKVQHVCKEYLRLRDEFRDIREKVVQHFFWAQYNHLIWVIGTRYADDVDRFKDQATEDRVRREAEPLYQAWLDDDQTWMEVQSFHPAVTFPDDKLVTVDDFYRDLRTEINAKIMEERRAQARSIMHFPGAIGTYNEQSITGSNTAVQAASADD